ncbi:hypothetical protein MFLAVUS_005660 [Mucor flavus]|uniref:Cas12f1-like TNB domain-containing protein n=1 Tax=Mucor flavus TaxID=439312 RepID=A0ABP9YZE7_9FUNG
MRDFFVGQLIVFQDMFEGELDIANFRADPFRELVLRALEPVRLGVRIEPIVGDLGMQDWWEEDQKRLHSLVAITGAEILVVMESIAYIVEKKRQKLNRDVPDTTATETQEREEVTCKRCGQRGHKDGRSRSCRFNKIFDPAAYDLLFSSFIYLLSEHKAEDRKRKREDDSTTAGRSAKRNTADSVGEDSTASEVETINLTLAKQLANRRARAAGKQDRDRKIKNPAAMRPCPDCVKNNCYYDENPHSSRRSALCPGHIMSTTNYIEENVGRGYRRFVRKTDLESCIILAQQEKDAFLRIIRHCFSNNLEIPPIVFNQAFFYACIQKILGRNITNTNANLPREHINTVFQEYNRIFFTCHFVLRPNRNVHANALASLATSSADVTAAPRRNLQVFKLNHSVNSTTRTNWPESIENTAEKVARTNTIINACKVDNEPVTMTLMSANPERFLRKMYDMLVYLEEYSNGQITAFNEVQIEAAYARLKQTVTSSEHFKTLNRKKKNRLAFLLYRCIRDSANFMNNLQLNVNQNQFLVNLVQTTQEQLRNSRTYLQENTDTRIEDCFRPEMATSIKQYKMFSLTRLYSFTLKYVEIDIAHLKSLLLKVRRELQSDDIIDEGDNENKHERATYFFSQVFDFDSVRLDLNYNGKAMFTNMVRTDGYGIAFILTGPQNQAAALPDLENSNFSLEELEAHQVRKYSAAEYYTRAGFKRTNQRIIDLKNEDEKILQAERQITTFKTANLQIFILYVHSVLNNLNTLLAFYDDRFTALRFLNYIGRQRADAETINIFVTGGKKYLKREFKQTDDRIPLVALGDAVFPTSMKGTLPGLARRLGKLLKQAEYEGLLVTVPVTEYMTSRTCSNCYRNDTQNLQIGGVSLFDVLHCLNQNCNTLWQRDVDASRNMHRISYTAITTGETPIMFRR